SIKTKWDEAKAFLGSIDLWSIGKDIIAGLVRGIEAVDVWSAVVNVGSSIKNAFTSFFKVKSPSRLMKNDVGRWITLGVLDGMVAMSSKAEREATIVANAIKRPFDEMNKDYTFTAGVASARSQYMNSQRGPNAQQTPTESHNYEGMFNGARFV